jgi:hypothetical protein
MSHQLGEWLAVDHAAGAQDLAVKGVPALEAPPEFQPIFDQDLGDTPPARGEPGGNLVQASRDALPAAPVWLAAQARPVGHAR